MRAGRRASAKLYDDVPSTYTKSAAAVVAVVAVAAAVPFYIWQRIFICFLEKRRRLVS